MISQVHAHPGVQISTALQSHNVKGEPVQCGGPSACQSRLHDRLPILVWFLSEDQFFSVRVNQRLAPRPEAAEYQVGRVAAARRIPEARVRELLARAIDHSGAIIGAPPRVNVLKLNLALDGADTSE